MAKIRSEYIKKLMEEKESSLGQLEENTKESLKALMNESLNNNIRRILSEDLDDEENEEPMNDEVITSTETTEETPEGEIEGSVETTETEPNDDFEEESDVVAMDVDGDEDFEKALEDYKNENGEFDITSMPMQDFLTVYKKLDPNKDGFRVVKDGSYLRVSDDANKTEYLIQVELDGSSDDVIAEEPSVMESFGRRAKKRINEEDCVYTEKVKCNLEDCECGSDNGEYYKRFLPKKSTKLPKANKVEDVYEIEVDASKVLANANKVVTEAEEVEGVEIEMNDTNEVSSPLARKYFEGQPGRAGDSRNGFANLNRRKKRFSGEDKQVNEGLTTVMKENRELKQIAEEITRQLSDAAVVNASMAKIIKLISENATTKAEKEEIVNRFNEAHSIKEVDKLYETINNELKHVNTMNKTIKGIDKSMSNGCEIVKTNLIKESTELDKTISLMKRMENLK